MAETQGELINTEFTNCGTVYELVLTVIACEKQLTVIAEAIMSSNFFIVDLGFTIKLYLFWHFKDSTIYR